MKKIILFFLLLYTPLHILAYKVGAVIPFFYRKGICYVVLFPLTSTVVINKKVKTKTICESWNWSNKKENSKSYWKLAQYAFKKYTDLELDKKNNVQVIEYKEKNYKLFFNEITKKNDINYCLFLKSIPLGEVRVLPLTSIIEQIKHLKKYFYSFSAAPSTLEEIFSVPTVDELTRTHLEELRENLHDVRYPVFFNQFLLTTDEATNKMMDMALGKVLEKQTVTPSFSLPDLPMQPLTKALEKMDLPGKANSVRLKKPTKITLQNKPVSFDELINSSKKEPLEKLKSPRLSQIFSPEVRRELEEKFNKLPE